jgi:hypothetical protein
MKRQHGEKIANTWWASDDKEDAFDRISVNIDCNGSDCI